MFKRLTNFVFFIWQNSPYLDQCSVVDETGMSLGSVVENVDRRYAAGDDLDASDATTDIMQYVQTRFGEPTSFTGTDTTDFWMLDVGQWYTYG